MAVNYLKWINSKSIHYISNSGHDENGAYHGGKAGDQSGGEWELKKWYSRPWTVVLRHPDPQVQMLIAQYAIDAALNDNIGYDQYERVSYWNVLKESGYNPANVLKKCEADCTEGVTANVKAAGYILGNSKLKNLSTSIYSRNMREKFVAAGFKALTEKKYLNGYSYLLPGDILLYENHHAATNVTRGKNAEGDAAAVVEQQSEPMAVGYFQVTNGNYYIRTEADKTSEAIGFAVKGTKLVYMGEAKNGWHKVFFNGSYGWISRNAGKVIDVAIKEMTVKPGRWWIRAGAGTIYKAVASVNGGEKVKAYGDVENGWYLIEYNNLNGYISGKAIQK